MGENPFGHGHGRIRADVGERIDAIARRHNATFTWASFPGQEPSYWFAGPDLGWVLNAQTERAVWADLEAEGLAGPDGLLPRCFRDGGERA